MCLCQPPEVFICIIVVPLILLDYASFDYCTYASWCLHDRSSTPSTRDDARYGVPVHDQTARLLAGLHSTTLVSPHIAQDHPHITVARVARMVEGASAESGSPVPVDILHKGPPRCPDWQWLHANLACPRKKTIASTVSDFPITHESEHGMVRYKPGQSATSSSLVPDYSAVPELTTTWHRPMRACGRSWLVGALSHPATRFSSAKCKTPIRTSGRIGAGLTGDDQMLNVNTAVSTPGLVLAAKDSKFSAD